MSFSCSALERHLRSRPSCPASARASPPRTCGRPRRPAGPAAARTARASRAARRAAPARCPGSSQLPSLALLRQPARHLLGEERVAAGAARRRRPPRRPRRRRSPSSAVTSSRVSSAVSGSRRIEVASRRPPPQPARRSSSSSRARHSSSSGPGPTARGTRSGRAFRGRPSGCPRRPAPAAAAAPSPRSPSARPRRTPRASAPGRRSTGAQSSGASMPSSARSRPALRSPALPPLSPSRPRRRRRASPGLLGAVAVDDPASARITSPSAQYTMPEPYGRQRPSRNVGRRLALGQPRSNSRSRRDLPTPAWPITVTRWGRARAARARSDSSSPACRRGPRAAIRARRGAPAGRRSGRSPPRPAPARPCPSA